MASDVTRSEFEHLEARVSVVESEVEGEKVVSRYILEQTRHNGDDLAALKTRLGRVEADVGAMRPDVAVLRTDVAVLKTEVGRLSVELRRLPDDLAGIVGKAVRETLAERGGLA